MIIIDGELVDTYGGDFTYRDVWYELDDNEPVFFEQYYGAKPSDAQKIEDTEEIEYLKTLMK